MPQCLCLKSDGQQCSKDSSKKVSENAQYCWQHQTCQSTVNQQVMVSPINKPVVTKKPITMKDMQQQKVNLKTIKGNEIRTLIRSGLESLNLKYGQMPLDDYLYSNEEYDSNLTNFEIMFNDCDLLVKAKD